MYEQNEVPLLRRILWIILWFVVVVAVIWVLVWLIFFRHSSPVPTPHKAKTHQSQSATPPPRNNPGNSTGSSNSATPTSNSGSSSPSGAPSATSTTTPSQLANTGAGNIVIPFVIAGTVGTVAYQVRLRKKLQA